MPATYQIRFSDSSNQIEWFGSRGFYYEFEDGATIGLHPTIAWCCQCEAFIDAEWIPSLEHVEEELRKRSDPDFVRAELISLGLPMDQSPFKERFEANFEEDKLEAAHRVQWCKQRSSPPKCLMCGSTDIRFPDDNQTVEIPGRGTALVECTGMCSTDFNNWYYTPDGVRIPRDTKRARWGFPDEEE
jgi:hypothetical protein